MNIKTVCSIVMSLALIFPINALHLFDHFEELKEAIPYVQLAEA